MIRGLLPLIALFCALTIAIGFSGVTLAQADKPAATITLPATGSTNYNGDAVGITNSGAGRAGYFQVTSTKNVTSALEARTYSTSTGAIALSAGVMSNRPGAGSAAIVATNYAGNSNGYAISAKHKGSGIAIYAEAVGGNGKAIYGSSRASSGTGSGLYGESLSLNGYGVYGINRSTNGGTGVYGEGMQYGVFGSSAGHGVHGEGDTGVAGVGGTYGVFGRGFDGVYGTSVSHYGVYGNGPTGVYGNGNTGVQGYGNTGVEGKGSSIGVYGEGTGISSTSYGGYFVNNLYVHGHIYSNESIVNIADPRDDTKLIQQAGVISPEQLGMLNGNVVLDYAGRATVTLPAWFGSVYGDFRYMLTPVGDSANLFIAQKVKDNRFTIAGGKPGLEVSWQISGTRQDAAAKATPLKVEVNRADVEPKKPALPALPATASDK